MDPNTIITSQQEFETLCKQMHESGSVAFDTEFVSEYTFYPELCLLQFAFDGNAYAVDPYEVNNLDPWWDLMLDEKIEKVIHGGREELRFCYDRTGQLPRNTFDVQLTQGLLSRGYPVSYSALVERILGHKLSSKETRTDWRKRPLTKSQLRYALDDVVHLHNVIHKQREILASRNRSHWEELENKRYQTDLFSDLQEPGWKRLPQLSRLNRRELATAIEVSNWRDRTAREQNRPLRKLLRDDLVIDLAKRQPKTVSELEQTRGFGAFSNPDARTSILGCVKVVASRPDKKLPPRIRDRQGGGRQDEHVLSKLLAIALAHLCAEQDVSPSLVATSSDLRDFVRWYNAGRKPQSAPKLASDWRAEICGDVLCDLLDGNVVLRVSDASREDPLKFEPYVSKTQKR